MPTYCDCEDPDLIEDGPTGICAGCGNVVRDDTPDPWEARIKELEQELATANSLCRIAEARFRARCQMLKEAEDATCNAVGDLETAENRIKEYEQKLEKANDRICDMIEDLSGADNRYPELEDKGKVQPVQRTCIKCGGTAHDVDYKIKTSEGLHRACWPDHEHLLVTCCACGFQHWQHCADHVRKEIKANG